MIGLITKNGNFLDAVPEGFTLDEMINIHKCIKLEDPENGCLLIWSVDTPTWLQVCTLQNRIDKERIIFVVGGRVGHSMSKSVFTRITSYEIFLTTLLLLESI